ncbi:MAG TPA: methyltransferase domain-containing protein [Gemmatimonadaceae bacterium]|nr:methyltransferase domain-containing protein [Gemmatimonadaceae bacterium]
MPPHSEPAPSPAPAGGRPLRLVGRLVTVCLTALPLLGAAGCGSSKAAPIARTPPDSAWTSFTRGLPADSFPPPSRRFSDIVAPRWTDEVTRDAANEAETVMDALALAPGMTVADVGAGDGYYVVHLARRVGSGGRVYGQDIVPDYLSLLSRRVAEEQLRHVTVVRGEAHDPRLPRDSARRIDAVTMIHMYHEITDPYALLWNLAHALAPGARVAILDMDFPTDRHGTPPWLLACELGVVGYRKLRQQVTGADEYLAIFRAPATDSLPSPAAIRDRVRDGACRQR